MIRTWLLLTPLVAAPFSSSASPTVPTAAVAADDLADLERDVRGDDGRRGREAVQELAKRGTPEAWGIVVEALGHADPIVADEAQLALGGLADAEVVEALYGKDGLGSKQRIVSLRVAEALGRVQADLDAADLAKAMKAKDAPVRRAVFWSIERQAATGRVTGDVAKKLLPPVVKASERDKDDGVRAAALQARCALDPDARGAAAREAATDRSRTVRTGAALAATPLPNAERRAAIASLAADAEPRVRWAAADAFATDADKQDAARLVAMLEAETNARTKWHLVDLLRGMSGLKHRDDPRPWIDWQQTLADDWRADGAPGRAGDDAGDERTASLVGLPILSDRLTILIDLSGSTWEEREGKTRKQVLDAELRRALEALPEGTKFNLIPYTDRPIPWKDEVVDANERNVAKALDWFEGLKDSGKGNFWDAWMLAIEDDEVDTVIALTDGAPTGGDRWNLQLMKSLLAEHNRYRRAALDAVVVDAKGRLLEYWDEMCASTGGRMKSVDL